MRRNSGVVLGILAALAVVPAAAQAGNQMASPSPRLQTWNVNTARMATKGTNYKRFVAYITNGPSVPYWPDVVTLQEAGSPKSKRNCRAFERALERRTKQGYACEQTGSQGGAAIVYRDSRLTAVARKAFPVYRIKADGTCGLSPTWQALEVKLQDKLWVAPSSRSVTVLSVHLPKKEVKARDCAWDNNQRLSAASGDLGPATMRIMAGDWNHEDAFHTGAAFRSWQCHYAGLNSKVPDGRCPQVAVAWKDAIYQACDAAFDGNDIYNRCLWPNRTLDGKRLDFLFTDAFAIYDQVTVPFGRGVHYSDHRGQGALLSYGPLPTRPPQPARAASRHAGRGA